VIVKVAVQKAGIMTTLVVVTLCLRKKTVRIVFAVTLSNCHELCQFLAE